MAASLTGSLKLVLSMVEQNALAQSLDTTDATVARTKTITLTNGTTANKANTVWASLNRTLTSGNNEEIDLYDLGALDIGAGAGKDPLGVAIANAEIVALIIVSESASVGTVAVGGTTGATGNEFVSWVGDKTDLVKVLPGGFLAIATGNDPAYAVVDSTNHKIKIAASGGNVTYSIYLVGRNA